MMLSTIIALILFAVVLRPQILRLAKCRTFIGKPHAFDGDTVGIAGEIIRMRYIDAPEMGQPLNWQTVDAGELARRHLVALLSNKEVTIITKGRDIYDRHLGIITTDGKELNRAMIEDGYAIAYFTAPLRYRWLEIKARLKGAGLWKQGGFANPHGFRCAKKDDRAPPASPRKRLTFLR